ncbi:hypothetical protein BDL97_19G092200 [Sphagnum fallax]|nr:hypothetical protein BDL97_19G092200 [Sphagnum fallax]
MGQTHPEQHGSPAWTYISTILFGIHNSFVEDGFRSANCDMQFVKKRVLKLVIAPIFHSSMVSVDLILMKIEDPVFLSERRSGDANCCYPSLIVLYFSSCHRLGAFNSFKLVFIIIMHFLHFNSSMQVPGVGN